MLQTKIDTTTEHTFHHLEKDRRLHDRVLFKTKSRLYLKNGTLEGITDNVSFSGTFLLLKHPPLGLEIGDKGVFEFVICEGERELRTKFLCEVKHIKEDGVGLNFIEDRFLPNMPVAVKRSGGKLEGGWEVMELGQPVPEMVANMIEKKEKLGPCVVCVQKDGKKKQINYKVYTVQELEAIQQQAGKLAELH